MHSASLNVNVAWALAFVALNILSPFLVGNNVSLFCTIYWPWPWSLRLTQMEWISLKKTNCIRFPPSPFHFRLLLTSSDLRSKHLIKHIHNKVSHNCSYMRVTKMGMAFQEGSQYLQRLFLLWNHVFWWPEMLQTNCSLWGLAVLCSDAWRTSKDVPSILICHM